MDVVFRRLGAEDLADVQWGLLTALSWNPERELPPAEVILAHPEAARYHRGWGRPGDIGVVASLGGETVGVAYARLFTEDDHGHGYVDEETPEIAIAVREGHRGRGLGERLLTELAETARTAGFARLSLSVDSGNPARRLYPRVGYRELSADEDGVRMLLDLSA
jgi:GNAT superfamily N-acetyltransferase